MADHDQFEIWRKLVELSKTHTTIDRLREAVAAAGIEPNQEEPFSGYYRLRKGKSGLPLPVAIWRQDDGALIVLWNGEEFPLAKVWPWCMWHPVPYEWFAAKVEGNIEWPDIDAAVAAQLDREQRIGHNLTGGPEDEPLDEAEELKIKIDALV